MASSKSHSASVEDLCANMSLEEEQDILVLEDISDETSNVDLQWSLFFHEIDMDWVLKGGPWTFNQHLLITSSVQVKDNPTQIPLFLSEFWIQEYNLPCGFMSKKVGKEIEKFIGVCIEADANNFGDIWRNFMCIRVTIDVRKPLKKRMRIKKLGGEWAWINFKYEMMPTFCFYCGIIAHSERFCEKFFDCKEKQMELPCGTWLRAPNRRGTNQIGEHWLRNDAPSMVVTKKDPVVDDDI
ncbi:hypothetical protein CRYUN_Cryun14cG0099000 [Craigia yunnanensis]